MAFLIWPPWPFRQPFMLELTRLRARGSDSDISQQRLCHRAEARNSPVPLGCMESATPALHPFTRCRSSKYCKRISVSSVDFTSRCNKPTARKHGLDAVQSMDFYHRRLSILSSTLLNHAAKQDRRQRENYSCEDPCGSFKPCRHSGTLTPYTV